MRFAFQHGWGFAADCWRGWLGLLPVGSVWALGNRGYGGRARFLDALDGSPGPLVLICHSLGLHLLPDGLIEQARLLVIIGGFVHFHGQSPDDGRFTRGHLQRLRSRLAADPEALLRDFHRDCGCPWEPVPQAKEMDAELLARDLNLLDQGRLQSRPAATWPPTLILHGQDDRIVRPQRARELAAFIPASRLLMIAGAGHGLPFTHPETCMGLMGECFPAILAAGNVGNYPAAPHLLCHQPAHIPKV